MNFSSIPSDCILHILNQISLHDLLFTANLVCRKWNTIQPVACLRRRSLKLKIGSLSKSFDSLFGLESPSFTVPFNNRLVGYKSPNSNTLGFRELLPQVSVNIVTKLPNIQEFSISLQPKTSKELYQLNRVLYHLAPILVTLELCLQLSYRVDLKSRKNLFCMFNRMVKLKNLSIDLDHSKILDHIESFPVLFQLDQFYFGSGDAPNRILEWLTSNENIPKRIGFGNQMMYSDAIYRQFMSLPDQISTRITHLPLRRNIFVYLFNNVPEIQIDHWCSKFPSLESLRIDQAQHSISKIANQIKPLTQLVHLQLSGIDFSDDQLESHNQQFPSVKVIQLDLSPSDGLLHLDNAHLHHYFPSVKIVQIRLSTKVNGIFPNLQPLKQCSLLKHIFVTQSRILPSLWFSIDDL